MDNTRSDVRKHQRTPSQSDLATNGAYKRTMTGEWVPVNGYQHDNGIPFIVVVAILTVGFVIGLSFLAWMGVL